MSEDGVAIYITRAEAEALLEMYAQWRRAADRLVWPIVPTILALASVWPQIEAAADGVQEP